MKEIRICIWTKEKEIEKCINILDSVLTALFDTEDIVITTDEVNNNIGGKLDDFLKEENIEISKLKLIENLCKTTVKTFNPSSGNNAYSAGRCITAEQVLNIINESE